MQIPSTAMTVTPASAALLSAAPAHQHSLVALTLIYGKFAMDTVQDWITRDANRTEDRAETIGYLSDSTKFLMSMSSYISSLASVCRQQKQEHELIGNVLQSIITSLQSVAVNTSEMQKQITTQTHYIEQLEAMAKHHDNIAEQTGKLIDRLELRIHTLLTGFSPSPLWRH